MAADSTTPPASVAGYLLRRVPVPITDRLPVLPDLPMRVQVLDAEPGLEGGVVNRWAERPVTRFERKATAAGRGIADWAQRGIR